MLLHNKRLISLLLALLTILCILGCNTVHPSSSSSGAVELPTPSPVATPYVPSQSELLTEIDQEIFKDWLSDNLFSYHMDVKNPSAYGLERPSTLLGEYTLEANDKAVELAKSYLSRLKALNRSQLSAEEALTYDTLAEHCEISIASAPYFYYDEPLSPLGGIHISLPLSFALFGIESAADAEDYLSLLGDLPRYFGQLLTFEQEKSRQGLFMTPEACDKIVEQLGSFASSGENCFLIGTFKDLLETSGVFSDAEIASYCERNKALVADALLAYTTLCEGLKALRNTGKSASGLYGLGEEGRAYALLSLNSAACSTGLSAQEIYDFLEEEASVQVGNLVNALSDNSSLAKLFGKVDLSAGTAEENTEYLRHLVSNDYPSLSAHDYRFMEVPEELKDTFSYAAYLIPPIDDAGKNVLIVNSDEIAANNDILFALAHEAYPGHMFQYIYQRNLKTTGLSRNLFGLTGYYEAWSTSSELYFAEHNEKFNRDYCMMMFANSTLTNTLISSMVSVGVNGLGWGKEEIRSLLVQHFGDDRADALTDTFYFYAVSDPFYYLNYGIGFSIYQKMLRTAKEKLGDKFSLLEFHTFYLDLGPSYFNLIEERFNEWLSAK